MKVRDVCAAIEAMAPPAWAYEWDRPGLAIGSPLGEVTSVLVALTLTPEAFRAAQDANAELIVTHHPPIFKPLTALRTDRPSTRLLLELVNSGTACYAAHTNLDVAPGGVNAELARLLGLEVSGPLLPPPNAAQVKLVVFVPESHLAVVRDAVCAKGAGVIGAYTHCTFSSAGTGTFVPGESADPYSGGKLRLNEEPERRFEAVVPEVRLDTVLEALRRVHPYEEPAYDVVPLSNRDPSVGLGLRGSLAEPVSLDDLARHACERLELDGVRVVGEGSRQVSKVGVLGGSGGGEIVRMPAGLDVLVTGDVKYHDAVAADVAGLAVVDAGHAGTEKCIVPALARYLRQECEGLGVYTYLEPGVFRSVK